MDYPLHPQDDCSFQYDEWIARREIVSFRPSVIDALAYIEFSP